ncbi:uncharacterized protein N7483_010152 [Penicillium malachiteum]|uniref:uncharacterized protein n=1 Tax=Penicillium malachiteum TaxID=1324776 RepID=UPI002548E887|nr:uncharacterized protein N7483_010152 [Penicillium malachiteum]KAJ5712971.1 hypothetical protein N7483_010152 [Penicillium malachiteum]
MIDFKQQLAGKLVNTKVINTLEHKTSMTLQHLALINTMLIILGATLEEEYQLTTTVPMPRSNDNSAFWKISLRSPYAKQWNQYKSRISKSGPQSAFFTWGIQIFPLWNKFRSIQRPVLLLDIFYESISILFGWLKA